MLKKKINIDIRPTTKITNEVYQILLDEFEGDKSDRVASDEILKQTSDQYRRIRNTFRFILGNINDFSNKDQINFEDQIELDKWIINEGSNSKKEY